MDYPGSFHCDFTYSLLYDLPYSPSYLISLYSLMHSFHPSPRSLLLFIHSSMYPPSTSRPNLTSPRMHYFERGHPGSRGGHSCVQPMFTNLDFAESQQRRRSTGGWFALRRNTQFFPFLSFSSFFLLQAPFWGKLIPMVSLFWVLRFFFITKLFLSFFFSFWKSTYFSFFFFLSFLRIQGMKRSFCRGQTRRKAFPVMQMRTLDF